MAHWGTAWLTGKKGGSQGRSVAHWGKAWIIDGNGVAHKGEAWLIVEKYVAYTVVEDFVAHLEMTWLLREMIELIVSFLRMAKNYVSHCYRWHGSLIEITWLIVGD